MPTPALDDIDLNDILEPTIYEQYVYNAFIIGPVLDKTRDNWEEWKRNICDHLCLSHLEAHIRTTAPDPILSPQSLAVRNWGINNRAVRAFIRRNCAQVERDLLDNIETARECWELLEARHLAEDPVRKTGLILGALAIRITRDKEQVTKARQIHNDIRRAFRMAGGVEEAIINAVLLRALDSGHDHTRTHIQWDMVAATELKPFESQQIVDYLQRDLQSLT
ncbi:hypothetical protein BJ912DRAFT_934718 [Pholiota molesta]|nr:hypothetical protein BJ912DRAFT_934718 [Pholiota molesta]